MSKGQDVTLGLSEEDKAQLQNALQQNKGHGGERKITNCENIRRDYRMGVSVTFLADQYNVTRSSIWKHLGGECSCETETEDMEMICSGSGRLKVCPHDDCREMDRSYRRLTKHIRDTHQ